MFAEFTSGRRSDRSASLKAALAMAALAVVGSAGASARADATIFDGTFLNTDWFEEVLTGGDSWNHTVGQQTTGGNPDAFRGQHWDVKDAASAEHRLITFNGFSGGTYNPAVSGALAVASYKYDAFVAFDDGRAGGPGGAVVMVNAALKQGDSVYEAGQVTFSEPTWVTYQHPSVFAAGAFRRISGTGPASPVFGAEGAAITFGYTNSLAAPFPYSIAHGVDNFTVNLTAPVPTTIGNFAVNVDLGTRASYAGQGAIATPGNTWNVLGAGTGSTSTLKNSEGTATSVGFHWRPYTNFDSLGPVSAIGDNIDESSRPELMSDGAINGVGDNPTPNAYGGEVFLDGLVANSTHDVALYGALYGFAGDRVHTTTFTVNGKVLSTTSLYDGEGLNYVIFRDVPADANGEILVRLQNHSANADGQGNGGYFVLNGFQIKSLGVANPTFATAGSGDFATASNWTGGTAPKGAGAIAELKGSDSASVTLNLSTPQTLGTIGFGGNRQYKLTGSALTLDGGNGYRGVVNVNGGTHEIASPLIFANGSGEIILAQNARLKLSGAVTGTLGRLSIATGATLDLATTSPLVIDYDRFTTFATFDAAVTSGRAAGGTGITSSLVNTDPRMAVVLVESSALLGASGGTYRGHTVDGTSLLLGVFLRGDSNLNASVEFADLLVLAQNYSTATGATWLTGDSNFDGAVNFTDLLTLAQNYNSSLAATGSLLAASGVSDGFQSDWALAQSLVPEPGTLGLLSGLSLISLHRRRSR